MDKNITVVDARSGEHHDVVLKPGTSAGDIISALGFDAKQFVLCLQSDGGKFFGEHDNMYSQLDDGAKVWLSSKAEVGLAA